jgi:hypothetical protein
LPSARASLEPNATAPIAKKLNVVRGMRRIDDRGITPFDTS